MTKPASLMKRAFEKVFAASLRGRGKFFRFSFNLIKRKLREFLPKAIPVKEQLHPILPIPDAMPPDFAPGLKPDAPTYQENLDSIDPVPEVGPKPPELPPAN